MKKILFLHDTNISLKRGAELTITQLVQLGTELGYFVSVDLLTDFEITKEKIKEASLIVVNSTTRCKYESELLAYILKQSKKFIKVEYDYNFCVRRNILCTIDPSIRNCCNTDKFHLYQQLFSKSSLNVFQSPKHYQSHYDFYGEAVSNCLIMPPTVDVDKIKVSKIKEENSIPFFGDLSYLKGGNEFLDYAEQHPEKSFQVYGKNELRRELPKHVFLNDYILNDEVLEILGKTKYFFCKPVWPEPSGRLAAEAFLSECEIISNENVGTWSFDFYPNNPDQAKKEMKEALTNFWDNVEGILSNEKVEKPVSLGNVLVYKSYGGLGDIFFCLPAIMNLKKVSKSVSFAVHPRMVSFFTKYFKDVTIVDQEKAKKDESMFDKVFELGNYPAFNNVPEAISFSTHKKVKQHAIQHYIDAVSKYHKNYSNTYEVFPFFEHIVNFEKPYYTIHPGAGFLLKIWPTENYAKLIETLFELFPTIECKIIIGPDDPNPKDYFTKEMTHVSFITGGLDDIGKVMSEAYFHIGNDAGITHVAGAFDIPTVGIYGPTGPGSWGSFATHNEIIWGKKGNCDLRCNYHVIINCQDRVCLSSVTTNKVVNALYKVLQKAYKHEVSQLVINPLLELDFGKKDCLLKIDEEEMLIEYQEKEMKIFLENLLNGIVPKDLNQEENQILEVFFQKNILYSIPLIK